MSSHRNARFAQHTQRIELALGVAIQSAIASDADDPLRAIAMNLLRHGTPSEEDASAAEVLRLRAANEALNMEINELRAENTHLRTTSNVSAPEQTRLPFVSEHEKVELEKAEAEVKAEEERGECTFCYVSADYVRASDATSLPNFQTLSKIDGAILRRTLKIDEAFRNGYTADLLAVSHRWEDQSEPDGVGAQMREIKIYLAAHPEIVGVWYDFASMPQDERTAEERKAGTKPDTRTAAEKVRFKHMLYNVNLLYLGCLVLSLVDISYTSRFWTQFEVWLGMQEGYADGLRAAPECRRRVTMVCIHNATTGDEDVKLRRMWEAVSPEQAHELLSKPDVTVTNQSDKEAQLPKILKMNDEVKGVMEGAPADAIHIMVQDV